MLNLFQCQYEHRISLMVTILFSIHFLFHLLSEIMYWLWLKFLTHFFLNLVSPVQCSAYSASASSEKTWTMRTTFPEYVVALATIVGSVLFSVCFLQILKILLHSIPCLISFPVMMNIIVIYTLYAFIFKWLMGFSLVLIWGSVYFTENSGTDKLLHLTF